MRRMSRRDQIQMSEDEVRRFIDSRKTITIVSNGPGGYPHPMPMWFARDPDDSIRMATYRTSQKILNIKRDPRVSLLCETGVDYEELRGVVLYGKAELVDDFALACDTLLRAGGRGEGLPKDATAAKQIMEAMRKNAEKRYVIRVKPDRVVSWDHSKLGGTY
jgi:nitroimidazol reductase NimA-like FMN-containing flavoprotein (pyridoxamine 5'-phosphate oxidase superfamily)